MMLRSIFAYILVVLGLAYSPASASCFVGDHNCRFHGQGRAVSDVTGQYGQTGVFIVSTANNGIDFDNQILLPDGHGPYIQSDTGTAPIADQPYSTGLEQFLNVGPENYQNNFQNGTVQATHSGDANGGEIQPSPPGCLVSIGNCEEVYIQGNIPDLGTPEGFEVKQTVQLYNYPGVIDPVTTVTSYAVASGKAFIIDTDHVPRIEPDLFAVPQRPELASRISTKHVDELAGTGAIGIEHTYNIGYNDFDIHAGGLVVFPDQIWKQASDPYRVSVKHSHMETPYGSFYAQEGWQHTNTYTKFDYNLDFRSSDPVTGMPMLQESNVVTAQWQTQSGIYGKYTTDAALQYGKIIEKQNKRDESLQAEMQIASAVAMKDYCAQPNGVCVPSQPQASIRDFIYTPTKYTLTQNISNEPYIGVTGKADPNAFDYFMYGTKKFFIDIDAQNQEAIEGFYLKNREINLAYASGEQGTKSSVLQKTGLYIGTTSKILFSPVLNENIGQAISTAIKVSPAGEVIDFTLDHTVTDDIVVAIYNSDAVIDIRENIGDQASGFISALSDEELRNLTAVFQTSEILGVSGFAKKLAFKKTSLADDLAKQDIEVDEFLNDGIPIGVTNSPDVLMPDLADNILNQDSLDAEQRLAVLLSQSQNPADNIGEVNKVDNFDNTDVVNTIDGNVAPYSTFDFIETLSGTHLRRTVDVDGQTIQINSGHGYNRPHSGGSVQDSGLSMDQIDNAIANDIVRNVDVSALPQVPAMTNNTISINGYSLTYDVTRLPNGNVSISTYYPGP